MVYERRNNGRLCRPGCFAPWGFVLFVFSFTYSFGEIAGEKVERGWACACTTAVLRLQQYSATPDVSIVLKVHVPRCFLGKGG